MPRPITYTHRHTGWQLVYGLRTDRFAAGYEFQYELGCLDATTSMPGGAVIGVTDTNHPLQRFVCDRSVLR